MATKKCKRKDCGKVFTQGPTDYHADGYCSRQCHPWHRFVTFCKDLRKAPKQMWARASKMLRHDQRVHQ